LFLGGEENDRRVWTWGSWTMSGEYPREAELGESGDWPGHLLPVNDYAEAAD